MAKNKIGLQFSGFNELIEQLDKAGVDLKRATEGALKASKQAVNPGIRAAMSKHNKSRETIDSLDTDMTVTWEGSTASIGVGFKLDEGGFPSIFLMYGTPRHGPIGKNGGHPGTDADRQLYNAIYGAKIKKQIAQIQEEAIQKVMARSMGG